MLSPVQYDIYRAVAPFSIGLLVLLLMASFGERRPGQRSIQVYRLFVIVTIGYLLTNFMEMSSTSEAATLSWSKMMYLFIAAMPLIWLDFCLRFVREGRGLPKIALVLGISIPVATIAIVFAPGLSGLMWSKIEYFHQGSYVVSVREHGPWFAVYAAYTYGLFIYGAAVAIRALRHYREFFSKQTGWILAGIAIPLVSSFVYVIRPFPGLVKDYTPLGYAAAALLFYFALFHRDLFSMAPIGRAQVIESLSEGILVLDPDGRLLDANPAAMRVFGFEERDLGRHIGSFGGADESSSTARELMDIVGSGETRDLGVDMKQGRRIFRVEPSSLSRGTLVVASDQTEQRELLSRIETLAMKDELTGLPNRRSFLLECARELARARRRNLRLTAAMIDFDGFKAINDERGHAVGDTVLRGFGAIVADEARGDDIIGRIGGDEFAILAAEAPSAAGLRFLCDRLQRRLAAADFRDESGRSVPTTISVGLAVLSAPGADGAQDLDRLLADADTALYSAKRKGRNAIAVFGEE